MSEESGIRIPAEGTEFLRKFVGDCIPSRMGSFFGCVSGSREEAKYHLDALVEAFLQVAEFPVQNQVKGRLLSPANHWGARAELEFLFDFVNRGCSVIVPNGQGEPDLLCDYGGQGFSVEVTNLIEPRCVMNADDAVSRIYFRVQDLAKSWKVTLRAVARDAKVDPAFTDLVVGIIRSEVDNGQIPRKGISLLVSDSGRIVCQGQQWAIGVEIESAAPGEGWIVADPPTPKLVDEDVQFQKALACKLAKRQFECDAPWLIGIDTGMTRFVNRVDEIERSLVGLMKGEPACSGLLLRRTNEYLSDSMDRSLWYFKNPNAYNPLPIGIVQTFEGKA